MNNLDRAYNVAHLAHQNHQYDIYPYMYHISSVVNNAITLGYDEAIVIGCILHDTMEMSDISYNDIKKAFGEEVAEIVYCVTDELGRNRKERKEKTHPKIKANWKALVVKICDRIANVEHSKLYNQDKFKMYKKEHSDFVLALKDDCHNSDVNKAWDKLFKLFEE